MTDRDLELIEAAGKAAGLKLQLALGFTEADREFFTPDGKPWNPLAGDGDALRLAVALELELRMFNGKSHAGKQDKFWCTEAWFPDGDPAAATRRAITRAAAALAGTATGEKP